MSGIELSIAASSVPVECSQPLDDRIKAAMRYVREHESEVFWMSSRVTDDFRMRTAIGAVMTKCSDVERDRIERSLRPLRMLSAAMQGIPVDFSAMESSDDLLPLIGMWHETAPTHAARDD